MAGAVQFFGKEQVMEAADRMQCPAWAIYHSGRQLFTKYEMNNIDESLDTLEQALDLILLNRSDAIYMIKFFEIPKGSERVKINEKTVCDGGSFNFKTITPELREQNQMGYLQSQQQIQYEKRIMALEQKLKEAEQEPEPESIGSVFLDLLKRPDELAQLVNIGRLAVGLPVANLGAIAGLTRIGENSHVSEPTEQFTSEEAINRDQQVDRLAGAIDILEKHDPKLVAHLEKLAKMAEEKPDEFKMTLGLLDIK